MPAAHRVIELIKQGLSYQDVGRRLKVSPGQAYLTATGIPADGSVTIDAILQARPGVLEGSTQFLSNPPVVVNPTTDDTTTDFLRRRAGIDTAMHAADGQLTLPSRDELDDPRLEAVVAALHLPMRKMLELLVSIPGTSKGGLPGDLRKRRILVSALAQAMHEHAEAERAVLWQTVAEDLEGGDAAARDATGNDAAVNDALAALARVEPDDADFDPLVEQLALTLRQHFALADRASLELHNLLLRERSESLGRRLAERSGVALAQKEEA